MKKQSERSSRKSILWIGAVASLILIILGLSLLRKQPKQLRHFPEGQCVEEAETTENNDNSLPGVLALGARLVLHWTWYNCHAPQRGEIAMVRMSRDLPPRPKMIRAIPGDTIELRRDESGARWNLVVNQNVVLDFQGRPYAFGGKDVPPLGRYIKTHGHRLAPQDVVVLSTRSPGEWDSGLFGAVGIVDLVAKVDMH